MESHRRKATLLHSAWVVFASYLTTAGLVMAFFVGIVFWPGVPDETSILFRAVVLTWGLFAAFAGGFTCAALAREAPLGHAFALIAVMTALAIVNTVPSDQREPIGMRIGNIVVMLVGVLGGAHWGARERAKRRGR